jgi:acetyl-CoA C-acetyltransferase
MTDPIVIVSAARTPMGAFQGELTPLAAPQLGSFAIKAALARAKLVPEQVSEAYMGCVLTAGVGQAPARQAALAAGLPESVPCTTVGKVCGSGLKAVMLAHDAIAAGSVDIIVAGGMESMSNTPYLSDKARGGLRMGHGRLLDHMFYDGLEDAYEKGRLMGSFAEDCAQQYQFTRAAQDEFALASLSRAQKADFSGEIVPVVLKDKKGEVVIASDESPRNAKPDKIPLLKPAFKDGGTVTAANSSSISDGAAALVLMRRSQADKLGLAVLATIRGHSSHAQAPATFATAPVGALTKLYQRTGWSAKDVDLYEINEAFAVVTMAAMREHDLPHEKVNINGGACALGHPIGASGARILTTLLYALQARGLKKGIATLCIGGGEAVAMAVEL